MHTAIYHIKGSAKCYRKEICFTLSQVSQNYLTKKPFSYLKNYFPSLLDLKNHSGQLIKLRIPRPHSNLLIKIFKGRVMSFNKHHR